MRIVYFDIDCLRPDHLGCHGYSRPTSPNIDQIAAQGTRLNHYYCSSSPCLPSRTAWLSGRFGIRNGVISNVGSAAAFQIRKNDYGGPVPDNEVFPRQLRRHGLDTISFSNFADRHNAWHFMCGWSEFHTPNLKSGLETAAEVNSAVLPWLEKNADRDDYLLHINYWDAHRCYKMDASWADRFDGHPVDLAWPDEQTIRGHQEIKGPFTAHGQFKNDISPFPLMPGAIRNRDDFEKMVTAYDASIAYVDYHLGQVLAKMRELGILDDAVLIVSSDHGDALGEHGIYTDHVCADECIHRIPLIIKWPGLAKAGGQVDSLLYNVDFPATICDLLSIKPPADWDGSSFRENLAGRPGLERDYLVWDHALYTVQRAVRTREHLLLKTYDDFGYSFEPVELYDMEKDPYQTRNIAAANPDIVARCSNLLVQWQDEQLAKGNVISDPLVRVLRERELKRL